MAAARDDDSDWDERITIRGAREHNLKDVDLDIPRNRFVVVTGLSGSVKSSLAFHTISAEGQCRYMESLSALRAAILGVMERPDVDFIDGLSPVIAIEQKTVSRNPRSTVGTVTEVYDFLRLLYARAADAYTYLSGRPMRRQSDDDRGLAGGDAGHPARAGDLRSQGPLPESCSSRMAAAARGS